MKLRYCTECASPLTQRDATEYVCANGHEYWNEPHGSVCVAVLRDGQVLLARRGVEPRKGKYVLPGGFVDFDETPYEAARREMREETGLRCPELDLLEVHTIHYRENEASLSIVFHAPPLGGRAARGRRRRGAGLAAGRVRGERRVRLAHPRLAGQAAAAVGAVAVRANVSVAGGLDVLHAFIAGAAAASSQYIRAAGPVRVPQRPVLGQAVPGVVAQDVGERELRVGVEPLAPAAAAARPGRTARAAPATSRSRPRSASGAGRSAPGP